MILEVRWIKLINFISLVLVLRAIDAHYPVDFSSPSANRGFPGYRGYGPSGSYGQGPKYPYNYFDQNRVPPPSPMAGGDPYGDTSAFWKYRERYPSPVMPPKTFSAGGSPNFPSPFLGFGSPPPSPIYQSSSSNYNYDAKYPVLPGPANFADSSMGFDDRYGWYPRYPTYPPGQGGMPTAYAALPPPGGYTFPQHRVARAVAEIRGSDKITGTISFEQEENEQVVIRGKVVGLPSGAHGLHILEKPLTGNDCSTGGEHYNPQKTDHGGKHDWIRHVGDLGNIYSDRDGIAYFDLTDQIISLTGGYSVLNRTVVITDKPDDLGRSGDAESKRSGNSGQPIACGLIQLSKFS